MRCPHCSSEVPIGQQFCPSCGKKIVVDFDQIQDAVLSDAADRRAGTAEKILINVIGILVLLWVVAKLVNDHYLETEFSAARSGSMCFSAPRPQVQRENRLDLKVTPGLEPMPRVRTLAPQGMSWRRDPLKRDLRASSGGGGKTVKAVLARGIKYLAEHQGTDGGWYVSKHGKINEGGSHLVNAWGRVGVTAMACLALMGDGHTWVPIAEDSKGKPVGSKYGGKVRKGINFLTSLQVTKGPEAGRIGPKKGHFMYNQGFATAALAEAYAMSGDPYLGEAARKAVNYIISTQQKSGGWDYYDKPGARADTPVTSCQLMALYSARLAGIKVPRQVFEKGLGWIDSMTDRKTFKVGYDKRWDTTQGHVGYGSTAMGLLLQLYLGRSPSAESIRRQAKTLLLWAKPDYNPKWSNKLKAQKCDYYYLYHATMAFHRLGGKDWDVWNKALVKALAASQGKNGSWEPHDANGRKGGRVYTTAAAVLALEVYYRYP